MFHLLRGNAYCRRMISLPYRNNYYNVAAWILARYCSGSPGSGMCKLTIPSSRSRGRQSVPTSRCLNASADVVHYDYA